MILPLVGISGRCVGGGFNVTSGVIVGGTELNNMTDVRRKETMRDKDIRNKLFISNDCVNWKWKLNPRLQVAASSKGLR